MPVGCHRCSRPGGSWSWLVIWVWLLGKTSNLKVLFHGSAHARVLRNLICVPANFWDFTRQSVEGGFHLQNTSLCITHRWSEIVLFGKYFIPALGFSFILLFLRFNSLSKVMNFQMWLIKSRATSWVTLWKGSQISFKSHHWQKNSNKVQTVADLSDFT